MAKLVKLTDSVGQLLEERALKDDTSIAGEIKLLLDGKDDTAIGKRLDAMGVYFKSEFQKLHKRLDDIEAAADLVAVSTPTRRTPKQAVNVPYEIFSDFFFDVLDMDDENPAWASKQACEEYHNSDCMDAFNYYFDGEFVYSEEGNSRFNWYKATPELTSYLQKKGVI